MGMEDLVVLEGRDLDSFLDVVAYMKERRDRTGTVRVCVDEGTLKLKIDRGTWSPPMGHRDPECQAAQEAALRVQGDAATADLAGRPMHYGDNDRTACGKWSGMVYRYTDNRAAVTCTGCLEALVQGRDSGFNHGPGGASCHA